MLVRSFESASKGMIALTESLDNTAMNLANVNTTGYKKTDLTFKNIYDAVRTTKAVYPDVIAKELVNFKEIFKEELKVENVKID